jgi:ABC-type transport system involved in cytochrome c biogenesis permease subunit
MSNNIGDIKKLRKLFFIWLGTFVVIFLIYSWDKSHSPLSEFAEAAYRFSLGITGFGSIVLISMYAVSHME